MIVVFHDRPFSSSALLVSARRHIEDENAKRQENCTDDKEGSISVLRGENGLPSRQLLLLESHP